jgi:hypothetical protein
MATKTDKQPTEKQSTGTATTVEAIASDARSQEVEYPEGCPTLLPVLRLSRARRSDYLDAMSELRRWQMAAAGQDGEFKPSDEEAPPEIRLTEARDMMRILAAIEDVLAAVAVDPDRLRRWALDAEDAVLVQAFNAYIARTQPGEASSSAS